jgi:hypothetical protein
MRIKYVRYADDFIVGVRGPKAIAIKIKKEISFYLKSELHLEINEEKTRLTDTYSDKADFLGFRIHNVASKPFRKAGEIQQMERNRTRVINRIKAHNIRLEKQTREAVLNNLRSKYREIGKTRYWNNLSEAVR